MGTLLNRRRYMGVCSSPLPYDAEVEYLESTGTQYIELDYFSGNKLEVKLKAHTTTTANEMDYISNQSSSKLESNGRFTVGSYKPSTYAVFGYSRHGNTNDGNALLTDFTAGQMVEVDAVFDVLNNTKHIIVNSTQSQSAVCGTISNSTHKISVFASPSNNGHGFYYSGKMYYLQLFKDDVLWFDLIPVRVGMTGYMYDKVSGQLFGNAGTGSFTLGPDKPKLP